MYQTRAEYVLSLYTEERIRHDRTKEETEKAIERAARPQKNPYRAWGTNKAPGQRRDATSRRRTVGGGKTARGEKRHSEPGSPGYSKPLSDAEREMQRKHSPNRERQNPTKARNVARREAKKQRARNRERYS